MLAAPADNLALPPAVVCQVLPAFPGARTDMGIQLHQVALQLIRVKAGDLSGGLVDTGAGGPKNHHVQTVHVAAGIGDGPHALGRQLVERPPGRIVRAERSADGIGVGHVEVTRQLPLGGLHHVLVAHHGPGLGQIVQGVHSAPIAALDDLLGLFTLAKRGQRAARCGCILHVDAVGLFHCLGKHSGFLGPQLLYDGLYLLEEVCTAGSQRLGAVALPLCGCRNAAGLDDPAHHVTQDALAQLVPRCCHEPGIAVDLVRCQHGCTSCLPPVWVTVKPRSSAVYTAS